MIKFPPKLSRDSFFFNSNALTVNVDSFCFVTLNIFKIRTVLSKSSPPSLHDYAGLLYLCRCGFPFEYLSFYYETTLFHEIQIIDVVIDPESVKTNIWITDHVSVTVGDLNKLLIG